MLRTVVARRMLGSSVKCNLNGRLRIVFDHYDLLPKEAEKYLHYIDDAVMLVDGVKKIEINMLTGSILILYNDKTISGKKLISWVDAIIEECLAAYEEISKEDISTEAQIELRAKKCLYQRLNQRAKAFNE